MAFTKFSTLTNISCERDWFSKFSSNGKFPVSASDCEAWNVTLPVWDFKIADFCEAKSKNSFPSFEASSHKYRSDGWCAEASLIIILKLVVVKQPASLFSKRAYIVTLLFLISKFSGTKTSVALSALAWDKWYVII